MVTLMLEHPGWRRWERGAERVMCGGTTLWRLTWHAGAKEVTAVPAGGPPGGQPAVDRIDAVPAHEAVLASLCGQLGAVTPMVRVRTGTLWEAIGTAIIRQVIRAEQARAMYRRFCHAHGEHAFGHAGPLAAFPDPLTVLRPPARPPALY